MSLNNIKKCSINLGVQNKNFAQLLKLAIFNRILVMSSHPWQYQLILMIESISNWLRNPKRNKSVLFICYLCFTVFALWGMFFVPVNILTQSADARTWVANTAQFLPWIDNSLEHYGVQAEKFVYLQSVALFMLLIPTIIYQLTSAERNINKAISIGSGVFYRQTFFGGIVMGVFFMVGCLILNNAHSDFGPQKIESAFKLNAYFSSIGASFLAYIQLFTIFEGLVGSLNLIHLFRKKNSKKQ